MCYDLHTRVRFSSASSVVASLFCCIIDKQELVTLRARLAEAEAAAKRADSTGAASAKELEAQKKRVAELQASLEAGTKAREEAVAAATRDSETAAKVRKRFCAIVA